MNRNYFLWIVMVALGCLLLIFFSVGKEINKPLIKDPLIPPPRAPYSEYISGVGIVESSSENIFIGTSLNRIVENVLVKVGDSVKKGDVLIKLENSDLEASLKEQQLAYDTALAKYKRLQSYPRPEDILEAAANVKNAQAALDFAKHQQEMVMGLSNPQAISREERSRRLLNYQQAESKLEQVQAETAKIKSGTWKPDLDISELEVQQAQANTKRIETEIERTLIKSPIEGTILQVNIHAGESPSTERMPMMILGNIDQKFLNVSINQLDIPQFDKNSPAVAFFQDDAKTEFPLEFVRTEPLLVNKRNLNNEITEKVDTRVLHVIYAIKKDSPHLFIGLQMDAFIKANGAP